MAEKHNNMSPPCHTGSFERLNYYFGKLMTVCDFKTEQDYFNEKRWLLNRRTIGWGVVCGLNVIKKADCPSQVIVKPGLALDHYGNEIVVCQPQVIDILPKDGNQSVEQSEESETTTWFVCIEYEECYSEPVLRPVEECGDIRTDCEYNRIRETFELKAVDVESELYLEIKSQCEGPFKPEENKDFDCIEFLEDPCPSIIESCEPRNQCAWLVLAKVTVINDVVQEEIDNCTYRKLLLSNDKLYQVSQCLKEQLWKVHSARIDRRQFVPILAQTIKGLEYTDGRILSLTEVGEIEIGPYPFSITTDGDHVWFTDRKEEFIRKLSRDGKTIEKIELEYPGWGIAFDGEYMWVTHIAPDENKGKMSRVNVTDTNDIQPIDLETVEAREIVFDGQYMWISHLNNCITKVDTKDPTEPEVFDWPEKITAPITALALDGSVLLALDGSVLSDDRALWVGYDVSNGLRKIGINEDPITVSDPISINDGNPKGIFFDGTHIWVGHEHGASKIDINLIKQIGTVEQVTNLTRVAFDGMYIWTLQPNQNTANRIDIFDIRVMGNVQIREVKKEEKHQILRLCFDGIFIWITAFKEEAEGEKQTSGIVYRLLI